VSAAKEALLKVTIRQVKRSILQKRFMVPPVETSFHLMNNVTAYAGTRDLILEDNAIEDFNINVK
jgi:hypothetical protein